MRKIAITLASIAALGTAGCTGMTASDQNALGGGAFGATAGFLTAKALGSNSNWTVIATLAGAAAGTMVARNQSTNDCAYSRGDGTYYSAPCPS